MSQLLYLLGSYTNHEFVCKLTLASYDQVPENFEKNFYVEFTQPATCVSHTVLRNVSIQGGSGEPPEKFVKYLARHEYKLEIDFTEKEVSSYKAAVKKAPEPEPEPEPEGDSYFPSEKRTEDSDSDSDWVNVTVDNNQYLPLLMACRDIINYPKLNTKTNLESLWIFCVNVAASTASKNVTILKLFSLEPVDIY